MARPIKHGTAAQLADHGVGFSANGESQWSRRSASVPKIALSRGTRTDGRLIREVERDLGKLRHQASIEREPVRLAKLRKNITIKSAFLKKLQGHSDETHPTARSEHALPQSRRLSETQVTTLPGEDEASWD